MSTKYYKTDKGYYYKTTQTGGTTRISKKIYKEEMNGGGYSVTPHRYPQPLRLNALPQTQQEFEQDIERQQQIQRRRRHGQHTLGFNAPTTRHTQLRQTNINTVLPRTQHSQMLRDMVYHEQNLRRQHDIITDEYFQRNGVPEEDRTQLEINMLTTRLLELNLEQQQERPPEIPRGRGRGRGRGRNTVINTTRQRHEKRDFQRNPQSNSPPSKRR